MFCNYCGVANPDDSLFCGSCGRRIGQGVSSEPRAGAEPAREIGSARPAAAPAIPQPTQPRRAAPVWIVSGVAGLLAVALVVALTRDPPAEPALPPTPAPGMPAELPDVAVAGPYATPEVPPAPPLAPAPPAPPTDPLRGVWKTSLLVGDGYLTFTDDGRIHIENFLSDEWGIYVFSDGDLQIQKDSYFSHEIVHWRAQVSGDSLRVIEPEGASHVYQRIDAAPSEEGASSEPTMLQQLVTAIAREAESSSSAPAPPTPEAVEPPAGDPEAPSTPPAPEPSSADAGFGDLIGEGGFIEPLDK